MTLQRNVKDFASDVTVMLAAMGLEVTVFNRTLPTTLMKTTLSDYILNGNKDLIIVAGHLSLPTSFVRSEAVATFGKIMPRPTMAAGSLTYGFLTKKRDVSGTYFISSTDGFKKLKPLSSSILKFGQNISRELLNKRLAKESDVLVRAQFRV